MYADTLSSRMRECVRVCPAVHTSSMAMPIRWTAVFAGVALPAQGFAHQAPLSYGVKVEC